MRPINQTPQSADGAYERETIINFCDAEKTCSYYTRNYSRMNELRKLATEHPDEVKLTIDKEDCVEAEFPKKWVKIRPPMFISEERRAILVESGKKLAALSKEKAARKAVQEKEYDQMKQKYDVYKAAHPAQYQQPTQEQTQNPNMSYQAPAQPQQPTAPVQPQQPAEPQQPTENQGQ